MAVSLETAALYLEKMQLKKAKRIQADQLWANRQAAYTQALPGIEAQKTAALAAITDFFDAEFYPLEAEIQGLEAEIGAMLEAEPEL